MEKVDKWYKARYPHGDCKFCNEPAIYYIEASAYYAEVNGLAVMEFLLKNNGDRCNEHITEDMLNVIKSFDGGENLLTYDTASEITIINENIIINSKEIDIADLNVKVFVMTIGNDKQLLEHIAFSTYSKALEYEKELLDKHRETCKDPNVDCGWADMLSIKEMEVK